MKIANLFLGEDVEIDPSSQINNAKIGNNVKISADSRVFGSATHLLIVGAYTKISSSCFVNGFDEQLVIGERCTLSRNTHIMTGSGPWSEKLAKLFPIDRRPVNIGNDCWLGVDCAIAPGVSLGDFCIVAANSFVKDSFPSYSIIGGNPAKLIRMFTDEEVSLVKGHD